MKAPLVKWSVAAALFIAFLCMAGEIAARYGAGLGDPPLIMRDPTIEYLFQPGRSYNRFHNHIEYNARSMRSPEVPRDKRPGDVRVLVLGDSVVNGGALTDQKNLATEIASRMLGRGVWIGNISAGSWGPANVLAYLKKYGFFSADTAILVVSTHDLEDLPEFRSSYGAGFPEHAPVSAAVEGIRRYLPRYIPSLAPFLQEAPGPAAVTYTPADLRRLGIAALSETILYLKQNVTPVYVIVHPTVTEILTGPPAERRVLKEIIVQSEVMPLDPIGSWSAGLYRDDIHLNDSGQAAYALVFECLIRTRPSQAEAAGCLPRAKTPF